MWDGRFLLRLGTEFVCLVIVCYLMSGGAVNIIQLKCNCLIQISSLVLAFSESCYSFCFPVWASFNPLVNDLLPPSVGTAWKCHLFQFLLHYPGLEFIQDYSRRTPCFCRCVRLRSGIEVLTWPLNCKRPLTFGDQVQENNNQTGLTPDCSRADWRFGCSLGLLERSMNNPSKLATWILYLCSCLDI